MMACVSVLFSVWRKWEGMLPAMLDVRASMEARQVGDRSV